MKKSLIIASLLAGAVGVYAQGTLDWNAESDWSPSFYSPDVNTPDVIFTGYSPQDIPAGTTTYTGGWIGGGASPGTGVGATPASGPGGYNYQTAANFEVGLYVDTSAAAVLTDIQTLSPVSTSGITDGGISFISTVTPVPGIAAGTVVNVGLAAWYTGQGTTTSYATALAAGFPAGYNISTGQLALGSTTGTPVEITPALGLTSFSLAVATVPEPSTVALGIVGASAFLMRLRRKQ
jgi:hypothetical protein